MFAFKDLKKKKFEFFFILDLILNQKFLNNAKFQYSRMFLLKANHISDFFNFFLFFKLINFEKIQLNFEYF